MLFPRQTDHDIETVTLCNVQEPAWRHGIGANCVKPICCYLTKVSFDNFRVMVVVAMLARAKWAICDSSGVQLLIAEED
jgi:hypothetical protein